MSGVSSKILLRFGLHYEKRSCYYRSAFLWHAQVRRIDKTLPFSIIVGPFKSFELVAAGLLLESLHSVNGDLVANGSRLDLRALLSRPFKTTFSSSDISFGTVYRLRVWSFTKVGQIFTGCCIAILLQDAKP